MTSMSAGPRNVSAPGTAGNGNAPHATRSISYGICVFLDRVRDVSPLVDAGQRPDREARADLACQAVELEVRDRPELEGRGYRDWPYQK